VTAGPEDDKLLHEILDTQRTLTRQNRMEGLHDAQSDKEQAQSKFELGLMDLETKARIETVYWQIARTVVEYCAGMKYVPDELKELERLLAKGTPRDQALQLIQQLRQMQQSYRLPTSDQARSAVIDRNLTGRWRD